MGKKLSVDQLATLSDIDAALLTRIENGSALPWDSMADWMFGALAIILDVSKSSLILHCREARIDATNDRRYSHATPMSCGATAKQIPDLANSQRRRNTSPTRK
jgi:transcriptional regulator with XRE-family HTH domain